ncbi:MAG: lysophospholipase [Candidatus Obscuribacterales bacterium]|nr:lysophospholipase [Candidatus Obscuribacterales bacterium]
MKTNSISGLRTLFSVAVTLSISLVALPVAWSADESKTAQPASTAGTVAKTAPETAAESFELIEDGEPTTELHFPVYEWTPRNGRPKGMVLAIHGLTLHGGRFSLLGKFTASTGYYMVAPDMRGYGKCRRDKTHKYCENGDCRQKINYEKSAKDVGRLAAWMKRKYPDLPLTILGESLGATMALKIAEDKPELTAGVVLSSPAARVNALMYVYPENVAEGLLGVLKPNGKVNLNGFMRKLVSCNPKVGEELIKDPLVAKELTIGELLISDSFVHKTLKFARGVKKGTPILILAASKDHCVNPEAVTKITENIQSANQTIRWLDHLDHLLLESDFIRAATVDSLLDWSEDLDPKREEELASMHKLLLELGDRSTD